MRILELCYVVMLPGFNRYVLLVDMTQIAQDLVIIIQGHLTSLFPNMR